MKVGDIVFISKPVNLMYDARDFHYESIYWRTQIAEIVEGNPRHTYPGNVLMLPVKLIEGQRTKHDHYVRVDELEVIGHAIR